MQARGGAAPCVACALARHVAALLARRGAGAGAASSAPAASSAAAPRAAALLAPQLRRGDGARAQHAAATVRWRSFASGRGGGERVADADGNAYAIVGDDGMVRRAYKVPDADADADAGEEADAPKAKQRPSAAVAARERALARALRIVNNRRVRRSTHP
jgi:hypothetical protein